MGPGAHPVVPADAVGAGVFEVVVVDRVAPVSGRLAPEQRCQAAALHIIGNGDPGDIEEGFGIVEVLYEVMVGGAWLDDPGQRTISGMRNDSSYIQRLSNQPWSPW